MHTSFHAKVTGYVIHYGPLLHACFYEVLSNFYLSIQTHTIGQNFLSCLFEITALTNKILFTKDLDFTA
jgi:hypothetical protein